MIRPTARARLAVIAALLATLGILVAVEAADLARSVDTTVLDAFVEHRTTGWTSAAKLVTNTGASPFAYPLVLVTGAIVWLRTRQWRPVVAATAVLALGVLSRLLLSIAVRDDRPPATLRLVPVSGYSFPSGHAASSALLAGILIWLVMRAGVPRSVRLVLNVALGLWAFSVAVSRLYLGVHWVTDVVGSWLLAAAWLMLLPLLDPPDQRVDPAVTNATRV